MPSLHHPKQPLLTQLLLQIYNSTKEYVTPAVETCRSYVDPAVETAKHFVEPAMKTAKDVLEPAVAKTRSVVDPIVENVTHKVCDLFLNNLLKIYQI